MPDPARPFARDHTGADGVLRRAPRLEKRAVHRIRTPDHDRSANARIRLRRRDGFRTNRCETVTRVVRAPLAAQANVSRRDRGNAAPIAVLTLEDLPQAFLRRQISRVSHSPGVEIEHPRIAVADRLDGLHQGGEHVERLETGDHHRHVVALGE